MSSLSPAPNGASFPEVVCYSVAAVAEPGTLSRVVEYFALNGIVPDFVRARRYITGRMIIDIRVAGLEAQRADVIAHKIRNCVLVHSVDMETISLAAEGRETLLKAVG
jgi:hypothetical protein